MQILQRLKWFYHKKDWTATINIREEVLGKQQLNKNFDVFSDSLVFLYLCPTNKGKQANQNKTGKQHIIQSPN